MVDIKDKKDAQERIEKTAKEILAVQNKYKTGITYHAEQKEGGLFVKMVIIPLDEEEAKSFSERAKDIK